MKYIKIYENTEKSKYKVGDFVIIDFKVWKINSIGNLDGKTNVNILVYITSVSPLNKKNYMGYTLPKDPNDDSEIYFKEEDVVELISTEEAEMYINSMKYNI